MAHDMGRVRAQKVVLQVGAMGGHDDQIRVDLPDNAAGRALYLDMGFSEVGILIDRFRIEEQKIDDVIMSLEIGDD